MAGLRIAGPVPIAGDWDAATNTPALSNSTGTSGALYRVSVSGTRNLGSGSVTYSAGEYIQHTGSVWVKVPAGRGLETRLGTETRLRRGVTEQSVIDRANELAESKATRAQVDSMDAAYAEASYYTTKDALLVPLSARGVPGGVATLGANGKVPGGQVPAMGSGTFRGPYGATETSSATTGQTPVKIAEWNIGPTALTLRPLVYLQAFVDVAGRGRPAIEVRAGDGTQTTYVSQTLVAAGFGRAMFDDYQCLTVIPSAPNGSMADGIQPSWPGGFDFRLTAWLFDTTNQGSVTLHELVNACAYLVTVGA